MIIAFTDHIFSVIVWFTEIFTSYLKHFFLWDGLMIYFFAGSEWLLQFVTHCPMMLWIDLYVSVVNGYIEHFCYYKKCTANFQWLCFNKCFIQNKNIYKVTVLHLQTINQTYLTILYRSVIWSTQPNFVSQLLCCDYDRRGPIVGF